MPDATITSTASTFGTISGTFAADQSTVTGTITAITGTVDGSVGVPGPQGQQGIQGIQGIQGVPGAPGQGVAAGGNTGEVLQKLSATSYDTGWLTLPADYITSVTAPLAVTSGNLSVDLSTYLTSATAASTYQTLAGMSSYLTTATAASTYAVIAAGQPVAGSAGQVLTKQSGTNWDSIWATPVVGDRYLTTSTTSNTLSNTNKTFTIGTGLSYTPTQNITISYDASNHMHGEVLTYNSGTGVLTVDINHHTGSGTYAAWVVNVGGVTPATSVAWGAITGTLSTQTDLQNALDLKLDVTTAASTYYPLVGNPSGFLTSVPPPTLTNLTSDISWDGSANTGRLLIAGVNDIGGGNTEARLNFTSGVPTQPATGDFWTNGTDFFYRESGSTKTIASQSYVSATYQTLAGMSSYLTTASAAATYFTIANAANKADLASPTFTGTPTLPTGTIATTQSPGNNTTALATTAFVTAAVPAFATVPQTIAGTSTTTSLSPALAPSFLTRAECRSLAYFKQTAVSGSGGVTASSIDYGAREMYLPTLAVGRAGWMYGITGANSPNMSRADWRKVDFSKKIWLSGRAMAYSTTGFGSSYPGDANTFARITLGGYSTNTTGDMTLLGIGWKKQGGLASFYTLTVHNGTTRTDVATSVSATDNSVIDWVLYSEGNGNVSFYINGTLAASTSAGPTGITAAYAGMYREQVEAATTPTARQILETTGGWLYMEA